jgi:hypothetical protein
MTTLVLKGWFTDTVRITVPEGKYKIDWINPISGSIIESDSPDSNGWLLILTTPRYFTDLVLRFKGI